MKADVSSNKTSSRSEHNSFKPYAPISKWELFLSATFFAISLSYGILNIAQVSADIRSGSFVSLLGYLDVGRFFTSLRDVGDHEWRAFEGVFRTYISCLLVNAAITWFLGYTSSLRFRRWSALVVGLATLTVITSPYNAFLILCYVIVAYMGMYFTHPLAFAWLLGLYMMYKPCAFQRGSESSVFPLFANVFARSFAFWHLAWNIMRFVSFGSEWHWQRQQERNGVHTENDTRKTFSFTDCLCFCFYAPTIFGPIISYPHFHEQVICSNVAVDEREKEPTFYKISFSLRTFLSKLAVVVAWAFGIFITAEILYLHAMLFDMTMVKKLNGWGAAAFTWAHGQYFQAKYMVMYGIPWLAAFLDGGVQLLPLPIFISRVYLYTAMWKYFDTGLYDFMKRYIYVPLGGSAYFLTSTTGVFLFIFAWHGLSKPIAIWSVINFVQVIVEKYLRLWAVDPNSLLFRSVRSKLSPIAWRRLTAICCAVSFQMSVAVISIFLMGETVGSFIAYWTIVNTNVNYFMYMLASYCWVQTVFAWENWNAGYPL